MSPQIHHFAYTIRPNSLETVVILFEKLDCRLEFQKDGARWAMFEQKPVPINIQLIETDAPPIPLAQKISTHIGFLSATPKADIAQFRQWASERDIAFRQGHWSDHERWFDLPDIFVNFVIEIMHTSIVA